MSYTHPYQDADFVLRHVVKFDELCAEAGLDEANMDLAVAVLEEAVPPAALDGTEVCRGGARRSPYGVGGRGARGGG